MEQAAREHGEPLDGREQVGNVERGELPLDADRAGLALLAPIRGARPRRQSLPCSPVPAYAGLPRIADGPEAGAV
jgi:hypothetical protein